MPLLSLIVTAVFVCWLLVRDSKRRPAVSLAVWVPISLLLILGSRPVSDWFGERIVIAGLRIDAQASVSDQVFYLAVFALSLIIAWSRGVKWGRLLAANPTIVTFYLYFLLSMSWSDDPTGSCKRIVKDFCYIIVIAVIMSEAEPLEAIRAVYFRCACVLLPMSVVLVRYYPELGREYTNYGVQMFSGVATQKNSLGETLMVSMLFLFWDYLETSDINSERFRLGWDRVLLVFVGLWLLNVSQSKTALVALLSAVALLVRPAWLRSRMINRALLAGALCIPFLLFFGQQFSSVLTPVLESLGRDATFTGRTEAWQAINVDTVNPWIGAGFWNFWGGKGGVEISRQVGMNIENGHNGYLDIYLDGGVIGLAVLFAFLIASGRRLINTLQDDRFQRLRFSFLIVIILYNFSESLFARPGLLWFTSLLLLVDFPVGWCRSSSAVDISPEVDLLTEEDMLTAAMQ
jgi:exopolysaccharide production protein ExoQ